MYSIDKSLELNRRLYQGSFPQPEESRSKKGSGSLIYIVSIIAGGLLFLSTCESLTQRIEQECSRLNSTSQIQPLPR